MNNKQIDAACKFAGSHYRGCWFKDVLLDYEYDIKPYDCFVVNLDDSIDPRHGTHWCCLMFKGRGYWYWFDSFGMPPAEDVIKFVKYRKGHDISYGTHDEQPIESDKCGVYVIVMLYLWIKKKLNYRDSLKAIEKNGKESHEVEATIKQIYKQITGKILIFGGQVENIDDFGKAMVEVFREVGKMLGFIKRSESTPEDPKKIVDYVLSLNHEQLVQLFGKIGMNRESAEQMIRIGKEYNLLTENKLIKIMEDNNEVLVPT